LHLSLVTYEEGERYIYIFSFAIPSSRHQVLHGKPNEWRELLYVLFASLALITTRIVFRMVEFAGGLDPSNDPVPYHEAYFMCLDALPMFIAISPMDAVRPARILTGEGSELPREKKRSLEIV
jgi:hypothetical protein